VPLDYRILYAISSCSLSDIKKQLSIGKKIFHTIALEYEIDYQAEISLLIIQLLKSSVLKIILSRCINLLTFEVFRHSKSRFYFFILSIKRKKVKNVDIYIRDFGKN
jgi:hypothetical protein